jgi:glycosyltransferase involved in cell wall biosynthesis
MRILIVGTSHRAEIRGATIAIHGFVRELRDRGHEVTLVQAARPEHQRTIDGIRMEYTATTRKSLFPLVMALRRAEGFDLIHANDLSGAYFALRSRLQTLPLVVEFHAPKVHQESFWRAGWRCRYIGLAARHTPRILTPSRWLGEELRARYNLDPARMHVVPYGIGEHWFKAFRPPASGPRGPLRVVLVNMKGVDVALNAFARVGRGHDARLELYGLHKDTALFERQAAALGISEQLDFCGFVPNEELPERLAGADLLLNPTRADNFPQVLLETAALGIPALTSPVGGVPEIVIDGETGIHCPMDDVEAFSGALKCLLSDASLRADMARAARERAERNWRWPVVVTRIEEEIYKPLLSL